MDERNLKEIEEMENEVKYHVIQIDDKQDESKRKILDEFTNEVTLLFTEFKEWLKHNSDTDKITLYKEKLQLESALLIQRVKIAMGEINDNEKVKSGKEAIASVSKQVGDKISYGMQEVMQREDVKKLIYEVNEKVNQVKTDERVQQAVKKVKRGTLHVATSAYDGLKKVLEEKEDSEMKGIDTLLDDTNKDQE